MIDPRAALGAGSVVGNQDHERVVALTELVDEREHPADLLIGMREVCGEALHEPRGDLLVGGLEVVPGRNPVRPRRQLGARGQEAHCQLASEGRFPPFVPTAVEATAVLLDPVGGA